MLAQCSWAGSDSIQETACFNSVRYILSIVLPYNFIQLLSRTFQLTADHLLARLRKINKKLHSKSDTIRKDQHSKTVMRLHRACRPLTSRGLTGGWPKSLINMSASQCGGVGQSIKALYASLQALLPSSSMTSCQDTECKYRCSE